MLKPAKVLIIIVPWTRGLDSNILGMPLISNLNWKPKQYFRFKEIANFFEYSIISSLKSTLVSKVIPLLILILNLGITPQFPSNF